MDRSSPPPSPAPKSARCAARKETRLGPLEPPALARGSPEALEPARLHARRPLPHGACQHRGAFPRREFSGSCARYDRPLQGWACLFLPSLIKYAQSSDHARFDSARKAESPMKQGVKAIKRLWLIWPTRPSIVLRVDTFTRSRGTVHGESRSEVPNSWPCSR